ncbi:MAG: large conductance mechanosensitive channel protein MscL, partial [Gordonia sp. (in: high G+C Gram-positive bacteria)]
SLRYPQQNQSENCTGRRTSVLKGFKEFILRGNVVELATAVIIGAAFTAIVTAFTDHIIGPLLAAIPTGNKDCGQKMATGGEQAQTAAVQVCGFGKNIIASNDATFVDFGAVIAAIINFIIVAAVVYFLIVVPYNKLTRLSTLNKKEEADVTLTEVDLLTEIRDLMASTNAADHAAATATPNPAGSYPPGSYPPGGFPPPPADGPRHGR